MSKENAGVPPEAEVLAAFDALDRACEGDDPGAICDLFVPDADATFWGSAETERAVGPDEIRKLAEAIVSAPGSFELRWTERVVQVVGGVAWVNAVGWAVWDPGDGNVRELPYRATGVLLRRDGRWLWHTHHGSEPDG